MLLRARGRESITLTLCVLSWAAVTFQFLVRGNAADIQQYGVAVGAILLIWLGREWKEKDLEAARDNA